MVTFRSIKLLKYLLLIFLLTQHFFSLADSNRAFKLLEKQEFDKLRNLLNKSIEKDSVNAGAKYVYSLLYLTPQYRRYDIDTAYQYIQSAIFDFGQEDEKEIHRLEKLNINDSTLHLQKSHVEDQAFMRAKAKQTVEDFDYFIKQFHTASQLDSAIALRNQLAYNQAVDANTYQAFEQFMHRYPNAEQFSLAKAKYEALHYQANTEKGNLESYERFVKNNPNSPFLSNAEKNIFEISTADNQLDSYMTFIERYPKSKWKRQALNYMYHVYKTLSSAQGFANRFNILEEGDSLLKMAQVESGFVMPIYEMGKYGFIKDDGRKLIDFTYDSVPGSYYCGDIEADYLNVTLGNDHMLVSRLGGKIFSGEFELVEDLGCGVLKIEQNGQYGAVHKTGEQLLDFKYDDVGLLSNAFIKFKENGKWGLISLSRREILPAKYDDISAEGRFILIKYKNNLAVQNVPSLSRAADDNPPKLRFEFDDYVLMDDLHLLLFSGKKETIIDETLKTGIPLGTHNIYSLYQGWYVREPDGKFRVYDPIFYPYSDQEYDKIIHNENRTAIKLDDKWAIFNQDKSFPTSFPYDSVQFLSTRIAILYRGDYKYGVFSNDTIMNLTGANELRLLKPASLSENEAKNAQYLLTKNGRDNYKVYNIDGDLILNGRYNDVEALGQEYLVVEKSGKKGLIDKSGKILLKPKYQAIGNYENGYVSTLINGKFGIYNYKKGLLLSAKYDKMLRFFGSNYFIGSQRNKFGFVDKDNKAISGFRFDEVKAWTDTSALVKENDRWGIYDLTNDQMIYENIDEFKYLRNDKQEIILMITKESKIGILSNKQGEVIAPTFNDIINIGSAEKPVYFAEKYVREAELFVIIYYDAKGKILRKQVFNQEEYDNIYCG